MGKLGYVVEAEHPGQALDGMSASENAVDPIGIGFTGLEESARVIRSRLRVSIISSVSLIKSLSA